MNPPSDWVNFQQTVDYLIEHSEDAPFNPVLIAGKLSLSGAEMQDFFQVLGQVFKLRDALDNRTGEVAPDSIEFTTPKFILSQDQLKLFSDFAHLSRNRPIRAKSFSPALYTLYEESPQLFEEVPAGWKASPAGNYFAEQYISFRKLKLDPEKLIFESLVLELC